MAALEPGLKAKQWVCSTNRVKRLPVRAVLRQIIEKIGERQRIEPDPPMCNLFADEVAHLIGVPIWQSSSFSSLAGARGPHLIRSFKFSVREFSLDIYALELEGSAGVYRMTPRRTCPTSSLLTPLHFGHLDWPSDWSEGQSHRMDHNQYGPCLKHIIRERLLFLVFE